MWTAARQTSITGAVLEAGHCRSCGFGIFAAGYAQGDVDCGAECGVRLPDGCRAYCVDSGYYRACDDRCGSAIQAAALPAAAPRASTQTAKVTTGRAAAASATAARAAMKRSTVGPTC